MFPLFIIETKSCNKLPVSLQLVSLGNWSCIIRVGIQVRTGKHNQCTARYCVPLNPMVPCFSNSTSTFNALRNKTIPRTGKVDSCDCVNINLEMPAIYHYTLYFVHKSFSKLKALTQLL